MALLSCVPSLQTENKRFAQLVSYAEGVQEVPAYHLSSYKGLSDWLSDAFLYVNGYRISHSITEITRS